MRLQLITPAVVEIDIDPASAQALKQYYDKPYYFLLGKLLQQLPLPQTDSLVEYLQAEKKFMQECGLDYRDAARNIALPRQASRAAV